ncbi:hydroxyisourate hydrolase [Pantoea rodasii]|uniref:5-hydroxyisourate hydrolase n=1 Tax=Pantoea rodasii TaxID=1076549 RepID=A0A2M9WJ96_9GAMM|nr:hydroxyisourate hydrolase [Pantoea rodasii]ORM61821.1 hydroxyisourate hydrolase [Pantoea rodasii]PJZ07538.1 hydroxyisourate hydrolase [Pantoea rodasii]
MKLTKVFAGSLLFTAAFAAFAAPEASVKNPLSVHVLNLQTGLPTPGITVELDKKDKDGWIKLSTGVTDANGRITGLYPVEQKMQGGSYRVVFMTGAFYEKNHQKTFFPEIPVEFNMEENAGHYHIPLLLSPYGYSTYRGN